MATVGMLTSSPLQPTNPVSRRNTFSSFGDVDSSGAYAWPNSPPLRPSPVPDITSQYHPGRPIRPLPKRRLRDRLSAEHAAQIDYPPQASASSPIFVYPYPETEQLARRNLRAGSHSDEVPCADCGHEHSEGEVESEEEEDEEEEDEDERHPTMQFSPDSLQITRRDGRYYHRNGKISPADWDAWSKSVAAGSTTSSADGYESFENMSNKKKRKIPQSGTGHGHNTSLSAEMANMGISQHKGRNGEHDNREYMDQHLDGTLTMKSATRSGAGHGASVHANAGVGIGAGPSGPSRSRHNNHRSGRGSLDNRRALVPLVNEQPGIISTAMANAAQNPPTPSKGQENVSMLQRHASRTPPQKTDFTFTPEGGDIRPVWPGQAGSPALYSHPQSPGVRANYRPNAKTRPGMNGGPLPPIQPGPPPQSAANHQSQTAPGANKQQPVKQKKQRSPAKMYKIAARERKYQQQYNSYHNPPKREDVWICEFCEYEALFGEPPRALIASYEKKDMEERRRLAERRRLLEKAKMKGRKGKKGSKKNPNNNAVSNQNHANPANQSPATNEVYDDQEDEYYDEDEDEYTGEDEHHHHHHHHHHHLPPLSQQPPGAYPELSPEPAPPHQHPPR